MSSPVGNRPMRLLMTTDAVGGVWRYSLDLARALADEGVEVVLAGFGPRPSAAQAEEARRVARVTWTDMPLDWQVRRESELADIPAAIRRLSQRFRADAVQLNLPSQADGLVLDVPVIVVAHSCVVTWFRVVEESGVPPAWRWQRDKNRRGFEAADRVVAPSNAFAGQLRDCYGPLEHLEVVYNATRGIHALAGKRPFALAAGRWWDKGKNGATLDAAAGRCLLPIMAAGAERGPGGEEAGFKHVKALGPLDYISLSALLATAQVTVSPSLYEPFGLVALEAASAGSPLVLSDIPTYRELWRGCAIFFERSEPGSLRTAINTLAEKPGLRQRLGEAAKARADELSPQRQAAAMLQLYKDHDQARLAKAMNAS